jgi:hypothetical protein
MAVAVPGLSARGGENEEQKAVLALDQIADIDVKWENGPGSHVVGLTINADRISDAALTQIKRLKHLRSLAIGSGIYVNDATLAVLGTLTGLETLALEAVPVTDTGLKHLRGLTQLRSLRLGGKDSITDAGLAHLKGMIRLEELQLWAPRVTDAGLANLAGLVQLRRLALGSSAVSDAGLSHLRRMTKVRTLDLAGTQVRGPGLAHLADMADLEMLSLQETKVTEKGLGHLPGAKQLRWVDVSRTECELSGLEECPRGKVKLEVSELTARLFGGATGKPIGEPLRHSVDRRGARIACRAFSPDGKLLALGVAYDGRGGERESLGQIRVWDTTSGRMVTTFGGSPGSIRGLAFHKDSKTLIFQADRLRIDGK